MLVEVNIGREENKSGVIPEQLEELLCQIVDLEGNFGKRTYGYTANL